MKNVLLASLALALVGCGSSDSSDDHEEPHWEVIDLSSSETGNGAGIIEYFGLWTEDTDCMFEDGTSICSIAEPFVEIDFDIDESLAFENLTSIYNQGGSEPISRSYYLTTSQGNVRGYVVQKKDNPFDSYYRFSSIFSESYSTIRSIIVEKESFGYSLNVSDHENGQNQPILSCQMDMFNPENVELKCTYYFENDYAISGLTDAPALPEIRDFTSMEEFLQMTDLEEGEFTVNLLNYVLDKTGLNL